MHAAALFGKKDCVATLLAAGATVDLRDVKGRTAIALALTEGAEYQAIQTALLRAGATIPFNIDILINDEPSALPYLERIQRAGGFRKYETLVTKSLARIFIPKFPQLPAEVIPTIVHFWAHVGDY